MRLVRIREVKPLDNYWVQLTLPTVAWSREISNHCW
jgi:hypothetical protein